MKTQNVAVLCLAVNFLVIISLFAFIFILGDASGSRPRAVMTTVATRQYIFPEMMAGLGNQLFQLAAAIALSKCSHDSSQIVLRRHGSNNHHVSPEKYTNTLFSGFKIVETIPSHDVQHVSVREPHDAWDPNKHNDTAATGPRNVVMTGYFQYFPALLTAEKEIVDIFKKCLPKREAQRAVGIHVRRGDYLNGDIHVTPLAYYDAAMRFVYSRLLETTHLRFILFSDDAAWCKRQSIFKNCEFSEETDDVKCLADMAACSLGFIIANSTYSWWGAFLGAHSNTPRGVVCVPPTWYLPTQRTRDLQLIPESWHILT